MDIEDKVELMRQLDALLEEEGISLEELIWHLLYSYVRDNAGIEDGVI